MFSKVCATLLFASIVFASPVPQDEGNGETFFSEKENADKPCRNEGNAEQTPADTDVKTSCTTGLEAFSIMDDKEGGDVFTLGCAKRDEDCLVRCSDGLRCRAPDALKEGESCRDGIRPIFGADGAVSFEKGDVAPASDKVEFPNGPNCPIEGDAGSDGGEGVEDPSDGDDADVEVTEDDDQEENDEDANEGDAGNGETFFSEKENADKPCRNEGNAEQTPADTDVKTSCTTGLEAFSIMDDKEGGEQFTLGCAKTDEECLVRCSDGLRCRAPDALKEGESCRDGIRPIFGADGAVSFEKGDVAPASTKVEFPNGPNCPI